MGVKKNIWWGIKGRHQPGTPPRLKQAIAPQVLRLLIPDVLLKKEDFNEAVA